MLHPERKKYFSLVDFAISELKRKRLAIPDNRTGDPQLFCSADLHAVFIILEIFVFRFSPYCFRSAQTHPFPTNPPFIPFRRKEPTCPTSTLLCFKFLSNPEPGLTNCHIKWVSNYPSGKGSINFSPRSTRYGNNFKWTLPHSYLVTDQWPNGSPLKPRIFVV